MTADMWASFENLNQIFECKMKKDIRYITRGLDVNILEMDYDVMKL